MSPFCPQRWVDFMELYSGKGRLNRMVSRRGKGWNSAFSSCSDEECFFSDVFVCVLLHGRPTSWSRSKFGTPSMRISSRWQGRSDVASFNWSDSICMCRICLLRFVFADASCHLSSEACRRCAESRLAAFFGMGLSALAGCRHACIRRFLVAIAVNICSICSYPCLPMSCLGPVRLPTSQEAPREYPGQPRPGGRSRRQRNGGILVADLSFIDVMKVCSDT